MNLTPRELQNVKHFRWQKAKFILIGLELRLKAEIDEHQYSTPTARMTELEEYLKIIERKIELLHEDDVGSIEEIIAGKWPGPLPV